MRTAFVKLLCIFFSIGIRSAAQTAIDTSETFIIGGIRQYVQIKGKDNSKPILLFLHGGPGGSLMQKADQIAGRLKEHFIVIQWDQRETGQTLRLNRSPRPLTLSQFYNDTHELIDTLLKKFKRPKLFLAGYSWGSGMGFHIADKYPDRLYAYIAISPVINQWKSDVISLEMLKETMGKKARKELSQVQIPFENGEQLYIHRKWLLKHEGQKLVSVTLPKRYVLTWAATWFEVWSRSCDINRFNSLPAINCPVYFFAGEKDYNTNSTLTKDYYDAVSAPKKDFFLFEDAGHALPETHAELFQDMIIQKILPQTLL